MERRTYSGPDGLTDATPDFESTDIQVGHTPRCLWDGSRRGFLRAMGGLAVSQLTGCAAWRMGRLGRPKSELSPDLPMSDLVTHLNSNIDQIQAWTCNSVGISFEGGRMMMPSVSAKMTVERPRNFRLTAEALGRDVVDLGSNQERFWFWVKGEEGVLTARHDQLAAAQEKLPLPFEPDWVIEALGVIPLDESEIEFEPHPTEPKQVYFKRKRTAPDGSPVELVSIIDKGQGVILEHSLVDRRGGIIALAKLSGHRLNFEVKVNEKGRREKTGPGLILPEYVTLSWPREQLGLKMHFGEIQINPPSIPTQMFVMTDRNCEVFDIGSDGREAEQVTHEAVEPRAPRRGGKARL